MGLFLSERAIVVGFRFSVLGFQFSVSTCVSHHKLKTVNCQLFFASADNHAFRSLVLLTGLLTLSELTIP